MILIGEIQELLKNDKYPSIKTFINKPMEEKEKVVQYMNTRSEVIAAAPAIVRDVLNPEVKIPELLLMSDGKYQWRSDIIYYVEKYDLELPEEFVNYVLEQI